MTAFVPGMVGCGMIGTLVTLVAAAVLEVGGDAAMRHGLVRPAWWSIGVGAVALATYGIVVNTSRTIDFNRLMGTYIVVFFLVSQALGWLLFGERPSVALLAGGALVVAGGVVMQVGTP
jgi:small multidrug resistance family-3 protein